MKMRLILFSILLSALTGCRTESPEGQVKRAFETCVKAIDSGDAAPALESLAKDFSGPDGLSRDEAKLYLMGLLSREKVGITVLSSRIEIQGSQATQSTELVLTGRSGSGLLPQEASRRIYLLRWERQQGKWKLRQMQESK